MGEGVSSRQSSGAERVPCIHCGEPVLPAATRCPHCCGALGKARFRGLVILALIFLSSPALFGAVLYKILAPAEDYARHASELSLQESTFSYSEGSACSQLSAVGTIHNSGKLRWTDLSLEVQYFDAKGERIDVVTEATFGVTVPAGGTVAYRVLGKAARPKQDYASHRVRIVDADERRQR
jgi:hypothetical protein